MFFQEVNYYCNNWWGGRCKALDLLTRLYSQALYILKRLYSQGPWFTHKALALLAAALLTERCSAVALHPGLDHRSIFSTGPFHPLKSNHIITLVQSTLQTTAVNFHWRSNQECWATWFSSKSVDRNKIHPVIWVQPLLAIENLTWKRRLCYCYSYIFIDFLTPGLHRVHNCNKVILVSVVKIGLCSGFWFVFI